MVVNRKGQSAEAEALFARSSMPRHAQLAEHVRGKIVSGTWQPGEMLPSESTLIETFRVSRTVVRQAMQTLESEGLIWRKSGKGTFVRELAGALFSGTPITSADDLLRVGMANKLLTIERTEIAADETVANALGIDAGDLVTLRRGVRSYGGEPFAYQREYIPVEIGRRTMGAEQVVSMLDNFRRTSGVTIVELMQAASAVAADEEVARHLDLAPNTPVLQIDWTGVTQENEPVVFARTRYRSDRYRHVNRIPISPITTLI
jgi:GntR family transcriptional regulator